MTRQILVILLSFLILSSCGKDEDSLSVPTNNSSNSINKILNLGASRVEGNRPEYESFRYELWKDLKDGSWTFDFIGTQNDAASYPAYNGNSFDKDHEGRGGWTSGQILSRLNNWLGQTGAPDIVLFSSPGGNDALENLSYSQAISNINAIIDALQAANPNVIILIEQLAPARSDAMTNQLTTYINQMHQDVLTIASEQSNAQSQVIAVNMYSGFTDSMLADEVHYNQAGADFIANRYYNVLNSVLKK